MQPTRSARFTAICCVVFSITAVCAQSQTLAGVQQVPTEDGKQQLVPSRMVEFKPVETDPALSLPAATVEHPHCLSDGSLVLRSIDWDTVKKTPKGAFPKYNETV